MNSLSLTDAVGLAGQAWLLAALTSYGLRQRSPVVVRFGIGLVVFLLALLLPIAGLSVAAWLRGMWGDLSISSLLLLLYLQRQPTRDYYQGEIAGLTRPEWLIGLLLPALGLYSSALGFIPWDWYSLGYQTPFAIAVAVVALLWHSLGYRLGWYLVCGLIAWQLGLLESQNLWDYLFDAGLILVGAGHSLYRWWRPLSQRHAYGRGWL